MKDQREPAPDEVIEAGFARRLIELRDEKRLSQAKLAELLAKHGLKLDALSILRIEKNSTFYSLPAPPGKKIAGSSAPRRIRLGEALIIANSLGVPLDEMLTSPGSNEEELMAAQRKLREVQDRRDAATMHLAQLSMAAEKAAGEVDFYRRRQAEIVEHVDRRINAMERLQELLDERDALEDELSLLLDERSGENRTRDPDTLREDIQRTNSRIAEIKKQTEELHRELERLRW